MTGPRAVVLVGDPVAGSVSPPMQQAAFDALGLDLRYQALRVPPEALAEAFAGLRRRAAGLNVTRPLKELVIPLLDSMAEDAARAGSVNTVVFREAGGDDVPVTAEGHSTDGAGFVAALERRARRLPGSAVVLGTGGAARAVAAALAERGASVAVFGRNAERGLRLAGDLGASFVPPDGVFDAVARADLVVNATPLGSGPTANAESPLPPDAALRRGMVVFDLVYRPRETALLRQARAAGCRTIEGIEMLIEQGARSVELWTGLAAPVHVMRTAAYQALAAAPLARVG